MYYYVDSLAFSWQPFFKYVAQYLYHDDRLFLLTGWPTRGVKPCQKLSQVSSLNTTPKRREQYLNLVNIWVQALLNKGMELSKLLHRCASMKFLPIAHWPWY